MSYVPHLSSGLF